MKPIKGESKIKLGIKKENDEIIFMNKPTFDCDWYWSFGYLGNDDRHYHLIDYQTHNHLLKVIADNEQGYSYKHITEKRNINMRDALKQDYHLQPHIYKNLWAFCELAKTIYTLKKYAELLYNGGSNYSTNPCEEILQNRDDYNKLVYETLPVVAQEFWDLMGQRNKYIPTRTTNKQEIK